MPLSLTPEGALQAFAAVLNVDQAVLRADCHAFRAVLTAVAKVDQAVLTAVLTAVAVVWA